MDVTRLPPRIGSRPRTSRGFPHQQLDQQPTDTAIIEELARRLFRLPGVVDMPSQVSVPGARALVLEAGSAGRPQDAFLVGAEFAHLHPWPDASLHVALPSDVADAAVTAGWAEHHPLAGRDGFGHGLVMLFAPGDEQEADVVEALVRCSRDVAAGSALLADVQA